MSRPSDFIEAALIETTRDWPLKLIVAFGLCFFGVIIREWI